MDIHKEKRPSVLLYGETEGLIRILKEVFTREGYDISMTTERETVLELLETQKPDVFILDVIVFSNNILQIIELVRSRSNVPIVILSIQNNAPASNIVLNREADGFVTKPFRMHELLARVQAKINQNRAE